MSTTLVHGATYNVSVPSNTSTEYSTRYNFCAISYDGC